MKLSIIVPVYNAEAYLDKCLQSILDQDLQDWECILIDDGSKDRSAAICDYYATKDSRFKVIRKFNEGVAATRNLGIFLAKGDWLGFVDSDDWIDPDRFSFAIDYAEEHKVDYVQCSFRIWKNDKQVGEWKYPSGSYRIQDRIQLSDTEHDIGHATNKIYKTDIVKENSIAFAPCRLAEDLFFNIRYYLVVGKLDVVNKVSYNYRRESNETLSRKYLSSPERLSMLHIYESFVDEAKATYRNWKYVADLFMKFFDNCLSRHSDPNTVDFVFPYVDSSDENWRRLYSLAKFGTTDPDAIGAFRFSGDDHGLLKYVFRGIEKYMPYIGLIHFVVQDSSQVPSWLNQSKVHVVCHKHFIPDEFLPTFNSSTIELFIPFIVGLSEKYVNSNDDFYPIESLKAKMLFGDTENYKGAPKVRYDINTIKDSETKNSIWFKFFKRSYDWAAELTKREIPYDCSKQWVAPPHTAIGYRKSICKEAFEKLENRIRDSITTFRSDRNISEYFYFWYTVLSGKYKHDMYHYSYEPIANANPRRIARIITQESTPNKEHPVRCICINDTADVKKDWSPIIKSFETVFPEKCKFELEY